MGLDIQQPEPITQPENVAPPPAEPAPARWPPRRDDTAHQMLAGYVFGALAAAASVLFNVVGSLVVGQHPLHVIRVYGTFPMGPWALHQEGPIALVLGCALYLGSGMLLGLLFQFMLSRPLARGSFGVRFLAVTALALAVWAFVFYAILSWLQPRLHGDRWILNEIPWWVAASTHLVFGWTFLLIQPLGVLIPYRRRTKAVT